MNAGLFPFAVTAAARADLHASAYLDRKDAFEVVDIQTKRVVARRSTLRSAHNKADKLDNAYGAVRYIVRRKS